MIGRLEAGVLMTKRTPEALSQAVRRLFGRSLDGGATRYHAEGFGWRVATAGQLELFGRILSARAPGCIKTEPTTGL